ncbi:MAG: GH116 family glycosyl-hydrolase [Armatimonadota bacterium]
MNCKLTAPAIAGKIEFGFESGDLQGWKIVDGAFEKPISERVFVRNMPDVKIGREGRYFLSTLDLADGKDSESQTGIICSPVFKLNGPKISFLIGGGLYPDTYIALCSEDGAELLRAGGTWNDNMRRVFWDVTDWVGRNVYFKLVDRNMGPCGYISIDDIHADGDIDPILTTEIHGSFADNELARAKMDQLSSEEHKSRCARHKEDLHSDKYLFDRGKSTVYAGENLKAISLPVGGVGAGCILIDGSARRHWQIFNNFTQVSVPNSFFAVRVKSPEATPFVRALQAAPVGPFAAMKSLTFRGEYPFGWYDLSDPDSPVQISMETFSPLIPMDEKNSAIPCAIYNITAENHGKHSVEVSFLATQQNAVGYKGDDVIQDRFYAGYGGNSTQVLQLAGATILHMTSNAKPDAPGSGDMALAAFGKDVIATTDWKDIESLAEDFGNTGYIRGPKNSGPTLPGETVDGALAVPFKLKPGEKRTVTFVLTWHFPNVKHGIPGWGDSGNMYSNWWPHALGVAQELTVKLSDLTDRTRLYHDTVYASNLPYWLLDRITSQVAILRSKTFFWNMNGYLGSWEGCGESIGVCPGNCTHVYQYAQACARLFPDIGRKLRAQELSFKNEASKDGAIIARQGGGGVDDYATDGHFGSILSTYREHLTSSDGEWLNQQWPRIKQAMDYAITTWDADEDGILSGLQWNTLDNSLSGSTSWMGMLYLASLAACEKMAIIKSEPEVAARYARIRELGQAKQDQTLFNGDYYIQLPNPTPGRDYGTGCCIDQVVGQWWANQLDLGWLYPKEHVRTALLSLFKNNFHGDFYNITQTPRKFVDENDAGMQMITWPYGGRPDSEQCTMYVDEVMTGFEYSASAAMIQAGLLREGFTVARAIHDRYDGRLRPNLTAGDNASWGYSGNPFGDDECGKFYGRAMSVWSILLACQGFIYDGPAETIGFKPVWKPEDHASFFTAAQGWGLFTQKQSARQQVETIELKYGSLNLSKMIFEMKSDWHSVSMKLAGVSVDASCSTDGKQVSVICLKPVAMKTGQLLEVVFR